MVNIRRSGIEQERRVKKHLEAQGWYVIRSAGSHGSFDLVAIHKDLKQIKFIQLKYGSENYLKYGTKDKTDYSWIVGDFRVDFELMKLRKYENLNSNDVSPHQA